MTYTHTHSSKNLYNVSQEEEKKNEKRSIESYRIEERTEKQKQKEKDMSSVTHTQTIDC